MTSNVPGDVETGKAGMLNDYCVGCHSDRFLGAVVTRGNKTISSMISYEIFAEEFSVVPG